MHCKSNSFSKNARGKKPTERRKPIVYGTHQSTNTDTYIFMTALPYNRCPSSGSFSFTCLKHQPTPLIPHFHPILVMPPYL